MLINTVYLEPNRASSFSRVQTKRTTPANRVVLTDADSPSAPFFRDGDDMAAGEGANELIQMGSILIHGRTTLEEVRTFACGI